MKIKQFVALTIRDLFVVFRSLGLDNYLLLGDRMGFFRMDLGPET